VIDLFEVHSAAQPQPTRGTAIPVVRTSGMHEPRGTIRGKNLWGRGMKLKVGAAARPLAAAKFRFFAASVG
jgi:hypothetical protein